LEPSCILKRNHKKVDGHGCWRLNKVKRNCQIQVYIFILPQGWSLCLGTVYNCIHWSLGSSICCTCLGTHFTHWHVCVCVYKIQAIVEAVQTFDLLQW